MGELLSGLEIRGAKFAGIDAIGHYFRAKLPRLLDQATPIFVVAIDHSHAGRRRSQATKQSQLGGEIFFHAMVEIEMVTREIGEDGNIKRNSIHAFLRERMGADFHDCVRLSFRCRLRKHPIQLQRLWRRMRSRNDLSGITVFDRANQHRLAAMYFLEDLSEQMTSSGFAIRAADADHLQLLSRMSVKI